MNKHTLYTGVAMSLAVLFMTACSSNSANDAGLKASSSNNKPQQTKTEKIAQSISDTKKIKTVNNTPRASQKIKKKSPSHSAQKRKASQHQKTASQQAYKRHQQRLASLQARKKAADQHFRRSNRVNNRAQPRLAALQGDYAHNSQTQAFIDKMVARHGFDRGYLNYLFTKADLTPFLRRMSTADANLFKKKRPPRPGRWNRYRNNFLTDKTINKGVQFWKQNRVALQQAEDRYGVPQEYILGIIGVETRYGGNVGKNRAIDALAAMGFNNARRGKYFRSELESYLLETRKNGLDPLKPMASYAGALGLCQFMPSNIKRYGVDFDRDGRINLWTSRDAIGSVANYFKKHGWKSGGTVTIPANSVNNKYRTLRTGFKSRHSLARLKNKGITAEQMGKLSGKVSLIKLDTYSGDELWLGGHNFYIITRYNHSSHYAMAVHQLAQAIKRRIGGQKQIRQASLDLPVVEIN